MSPTVTFLFMLTTVITLFLTTTRTSSPPPQLIVGEDVAEASKKVQGVLTRLRTQFPCEPSDTILYLEDLPGFILHPWIQIVPRAAVVKRCHNGFCPSSGHRCVSSAQATFDFEYLQLDRVNQTQNYYRIKLTNETECSCSSGG